MGLLACFGLAGWRPNVMPREVGPTRDQAFDDTVLGETPPPGRYSPIVTAALPHAKLTIL
jgi:hypothetical protein